MRFRSVLGFGSSVGMVAVVTGGLLLATASGASAASCGDEQAAQVIKNNFTAVDTAAHGGAPDGIISVNDLAAAGDFLNGYPLDVQNAANHIRNNPDLFRALDVAAHGGIGDGHISVNDLNAFIGGPGCG
jgi:nitrogen regulatory protein PII